VNQFKTFLEQHLNLTEEDWLTIEKKIQIGSSKKRSVVTKAGSTEDRLYFLLDGIFRLYFEAENKDITLNFGFPGSFISSYTSFLTQKKSDFFLESLTQSNYIFMTRSGLSDLYHTTSCGNQLGLIFTEYNFLYLSKRETDFLIKSPTQRYLDLFEDQAQLIQEIPQKYLASYIGITPQALSRIRAKI